MWLKFDYRKRRKEAMKIAIACDHGGLALGRFAASAVLVALIAAGILLLPQRAARAAH